MNAAPLRAAGLASLLAFSGVASASGGTAAGPGALEAKASIDFQVRIPPTLRLRTLAMPGQIEIRPQDLAGGVVAVARAAIFEVVCNLREYALRIDVTDPAVAAVDIEGLDRPVRALPGATTVYIPVASASERRQLRTLAYRIHYVAGTSAGTRPMPVAISIGGA